MVVRLFDDVIRVDGDFAAAARCVHDVLRDGVAGSVAAECGNDVDSRLQGGAEMAGAFDQIALVKVVGPDTALQ